ENFKGRGSEYCTHLESQNGWWLRIDHSYEWFDHSIRLPDKVGELMCPTCLEKYSRDLEELLQL
ncbi:MAG: hypothetical protein KAS32_28395, partial [Candidatus Peribacteraceae bacterium]|nr:hypothetical protein [Candidatus Peribacteraceae bacterium]